MRPGIIVLLHSPLTTAAAWGGLPAALRAAGHPVVVPDVRDDDRPPYAQRYVARAALEIAGAPEVREAPGTPVTLVGHSGAGKLLPAVGSAQRAAHRPVAGYVFADAGLPPVGSRTRLELYSRDAADRLDRLFASGGAYPDWTPPAGLEGTLRPRGQDFFTEPLPMPQDWPDAPCGYFQWCEAYAGDARQATSRGWPVVTLAGTDDHFAAHSDPDGTASALADLLAAM